MKNVDKDQDLQDRAKFLLERKTESLDHKTTSRLAEIRRRALQSEKPSVSWLRPISGLAAACSILVVFYFLMNRTVEKEMSADLMDIDLLSASESIEFYDELEFYGWLAEEEANAKSSG